MFAVSMSHLVHHVLIVIELVRSDTRTSLHDGGHVVEPLLALLWLVVVDAPSEVTRVDV
jgi:hypothetical protein